MPKIAAGATNKNISLAPNGTGKVVVGTGAADATVQSDGDHNLILQTGNSTTSKIEITDGANGDVAVTPNGTGNLTIDNIAISDNTIISTDTNGNIAITPNGTGEVDIAKVDIDSGAVDGITLGTNSAVTEAQIDNINVDGNAITSTDTNGNIALTPAGTGEVDISKVDIDGGAIDGITLGTAAAVTEAQIDNINIDGNAITSTNTNGNIDLTPAGTGEVNISKVDIDGGAIDGTNVTVGSGKTLDVSAGSLTTSTAQKQAIVDGASANSPNFMVRLSGNQSIDNSETATKIEFVEVDIDSDGKFASNKFTPTVAGTYFISCTLGVESNANASTSLIRVNIYKGSGAGASSAIDGVSARVDYRDTKGRGAAINCNCLVVLDSDDYIEGFAFNTASSGTSVITASNTMMCGFKLL